jgi:predicted RNase H-like HicB family nuclease
VIYERDETGWWVASVPAVPGCLTQGKNLDQARRRIREALSLYVDDRVARTATLEEDVRLPADVRSRLRKLEAARTKAAEADEHRRSVVQELARYLASDFSYQDIGEFLQVSRQRVGQLVAEGR